MKIRFKLKYCIIVFLFCNKINAQVTDYSNINNWAAHKDKWDFSDSLPKKIRYQNKETKIANVFFIYPTSYVESNAFAKNWNASVTDSLLNAKTDKSSILYQASCFNEQSYVYAPRYRQAHIQSFYTKGNEGVQALNIAYEDIKAAFEYFIKNLNNDMPIIIASHSQGTVHAARLIKEYFEGKPLMKKLVAAYLIGMPVAKNYFEICTPCLNENQTNCFVSWRTYLKNNEADYMKLEKPNSIVVINPLSWKSESSIVARKHNKGAVLLKFNKIMKRTCSAAIHNNLLWISKPKFPFSFLIKNKRTNYHIADINMFYINIRENVKLRLDNFMEQNRNTK